MAWNKKVPYNFIYKKYEYDPWSSSPNIVWKDVKKFTSLLKFYSTRSTQNTTIYLFKDVYADVIYHISTSEFIKMIDFMNKGEIIGDFIHTKRGNTYTLKFLKFREDLEELYGQNN